VQRVLIKVVIVVALVVVMSSLWIFGGRQLSLFLDRFGTVELVSAPIKSISYEGSGSGGILHVNDLALSLNSLNPLLPSLEIGTTKDDQIALSFSGHVFSFGERRASQNDELAVAPPLRDDASIAMRRSAISWPTPFDLNFMTGHSPSWKRHLYYRLTWKKQNSAKLDMLWRYEQYFYSTDGWASGFMMRQGSTGLIRVDISNGAR
jgi:hypothetical protein